MNVFSIDDENEVEPNREGRGARLLADAERHRRTDSDAIGLGADRNIGNRDALGVSTATIRTILSRYAKYMFDNISLDGLILGFDKLESRGAGLSPFRALRP